MHNGRLYISIQSHTPGPCSSSAAGDLERRSLFDGPEHELSVTRYALEHASDGVFWAEPDGRFAYVNEAVCTSLGYSRDELLAMTIFEFAPKLQLEEWRKRWRTLKDPGVLVFESSHRTRTGRVFPIEITINHIGDGGGGHVLGFVRDISALRSAQQALRARERRYRDFISHSNEGVWCLEFQEPISAGRPIDEQLRMIFRTAYVSECNDAFARLRGSNSSEDVTGRSLRDLMSAVEWRAIKQAVRKTGLSGSAEYRRREPDGTQRYFMRNHTAIVEDGFIRQVWGTALDITDRKRAEEALRESDRRFRKLLETVELVAVIRDTEGRVIFCNDHMLRVTGHSREQVLGKDWFTLFTPVEERDAERRTFAAALSASDVPGHTEGSILTRDGRRRLVEWDNTLLRTPGGDTSAVASLGRDVTDHRALEEQYRQAQKLESIGRLAGGVAHDFNNLLTIINAYSEFLLETLQESDPTRANLIEIRKASDRAAALTQQLLAFGRRQVLQPEVLDLNAVVSEAGRMLQRVIGEDVELRMCLEPALKRVRADAGQLSQALLNLAVNARDAMPSGGRLTISTSNAAVPTGRSVPAGAYAVLTVQDTGVGIRPEDASHIFEPFFTTKQPGKGTGLGLAMVYGIVQQSGGHIAVESEPGRGTRFDIYLPSVEASLPEHAFELTQPAAQLGGTETILVVEDQTEVRAATVEILRGYGYHVLSAANGREALAFVDESLSMILTDIVMPEMSGRELAQHARAKRPEIRILYMSGYAHLGAGDGNVPQLDSAYIQKPFTPSLLGKKVREVLGSPAGAAK